MSRKLMAFWLTMMVAVGFALGYAAWQTIQGKTEQQCELCSRPLHARSRVVGLVESERRTFCCAACALTTHRQTGQSVELAELTDFNSDQVIAPKDAYVVVDSDVNLCTRHQPLLDQDKRTSPMGFDRCSPSVLAFASEGRAQEFARQRGGTVMSFGGLAAAYR